MANLTTDTLNKTNGSHSEFKNKVLAGEHQIEKLAQNAGEKMGLMASNFANSTAESMKTTTDYVRENPVKGVVIAATAGLVAGGLLTMIFRGRKN